MNLQQAIEKMKAGETVEHAGKRFRIQHHAIYDVTDEAEPKRLSLDAKAWAALAEQ